MLEELLKKVDGELLMLSLQLLVWLKLVGLRFGVRVFILLNVESFGIAE